MAFNIVTIKNTGIQEYSPVAVVKVPTEKWNIDLRTAKVIAWSSIYFEIENTS